MTRPDLAALAEEFFDASMTASPVSATAFGAPGYDHLLPDLSGGGQAAIASQVEDVLARASAIPEGELSDEDRVTRAVLLQTGRSLADELTGPLAEIGVSFLASAAIVTLSYLPKLPVTVDYLHRLRAFPLMLQQQGQRHLEGVAAGRVASARSVEAGSGQLAAYLAGPLDDDLLVTAAAGTEWADEARSLVADGVRPALQAYLDVLTGPVAAAARSDDRPGLVHLPGGPEAYAQGLRGYTTVDRAPEEIHALGLELCASLREEFAVLGETVLGTSDVDEVIRRLREDESLRYATSEEILADARGALARAEAAVPDWFGRVPQTPCSVEEMSDLEAPTQTLGYYAPATGHGQPGRHWINTWQPHTRTRYEYEALAFHESVPGHHLQIALTQELAQNVPRFRRFGAISAFAEGWALYTERLADEMGLYSGDLARFGVLSFDAWRACRLVVDTGLHALGWTRQQAIDFMWENSALARPTIVNEVDRYVVLPGQACSYMIGRREIDEARAGAQAALGGAFDIRAFHDVVLGNGSVPLSVLRSEVDHWVVSRTR